MGSMVQFGIMVKQKSLAVYKYRPALVMDVGEKIEILLQDGEKIRVREKDIEVLHPGPLNALGDLEARAAEGDVRGAWELLQDSQVPLPELAELVYGAFTPQSAWAAYQLLRDGLFFTGSVDSIRAKTQDEVTLEEAKRTGKAKEAGEREAFLDRLAKGNLNLPDDGRFLQDAEALALGKTEKSRTLKDAGKPETAIEAHRLLIQTGYWPGSYNPYPARFSQANHSAHAPVPPYGEEERLDLTGLSAYAIDNAWSADPDDAVSADGEDLWVHVADPAASVLPDSAADLEARGRGATLYLPEGCYRMLNDGALPLYALGLSERSPALSFRIRIGEDGSILDTDIVRSWVRVARMTYAEADAAAQTPHMVPLFAIAERNLKRRIAAGAVMIDLPETHMTVEDGKVEIVRIKDYRSADMVRECMLLAGEGTARWALRNRLPFPYIAQEVGDLPAQPLPGIAGSFQLRRCMRGRRLSAQPGAHGGLGLAEYTQVTSPLRRYTDLLAHQQIRAHLSGSPAFTQDDILLRVAAGEAAASAATQAERASRSHWTMVYLSDKKDSEWEAVAVERKGSKVQAIIPELGMEIFVAHKEDLEPNQVFRVRVGTVKIPEQEAMFTSLG